MAFKWSHIVLRGGDNTDTGAKFTNLVAAIDAAKTLAKRFNRSYVVSYPSKAPVVTVSSKGKLKWWRDPAHQQQRSA